MAFPLRQPFELFESLRRQQLEQREREQAAQDQFTWIRDRAHKLKTTEKGMYDLFYGDEMYLDDEIIKALVEIGKGDETHGGKLLAEHINECAQKLAEKEYDNRR